MPGSSLFGVLCIRADGGPAQGIGHVMRCLALAEAWRDRGGEVLFVTAVGTASIIARLKAEGCAVQALAAAPGTPEDARETADAVRRSGAAWAVVDGYHFDSAYVALVATAAPLLVIDDGGGGAFGAADVIVNPGPQAVAANYAGRARTAAQVLAGSDYALLRREFRPGRAVGRGHDDQADERVRALVINMGGSDPPNATARLLQILAGFRDWPLHIRVIVGPANPHVAAIRSAATAVEGLHRVELLADPPDMGAVFAAADIVISAAGTGCQELAAMGIPAALIVVADNQRAGATAMATAGQALLLGEAGTLDPGQVLADLRPVLARRGLRARLAAAATRAFDGGGAGRVAERLATHPVRLRPAGTADAELLFAWTNDPLTRRMSFNTTAVRWDDHVAWLTARLASADCRLSVAADGSADPVGQVRLDRKGTLATLSFSLAPGARGRGYAARLLRLAAVDSLRDGWCQRVRAAVRGENAASLAAFRRAGFTELHGAGPSPDANQDARPDAVFFELA